MSSPADTLDTGHPLAGVGARVNAHLDGLVDVPAWSMTGAEQRAALVDLAWAQARLEELRLRVLAAADHNEAAAVDGATSTTVVEV